MKTPSRYRAFVAGISLFILASMSWAEDRLSSRQIKGMVEHGEIVSVLYLQERYSDILDGRWLDIELEREFFGWVYEFEIMDSQGEVTKLKFNARTGDVLKPEADD